jgi:hypothetical protein
VPFDKLFDSAFGDLPIGVFFKKQLSHLVGARRLIILKRKKRANVSYQRSRMASPPSCNSGKSQETISQAS